MKTQKQPLLSDEQNQIYVWDMTDGEFDSLTVEGEADILDIHIIQNFKREPFVYVSLPYADITISGRDLNKLITGLKYAQQSLERLRIK